MLLLQIMEVKIETQTGPSTSLQMTQFHYFLWLSNISLYIHTTYSSVDGHLGCFHVLAFVSSAAVNTGTRVSFWISFLRLYSSVGKESTFNAWDPGSIPELGGSAGEGIGYSLQYSRASLVGQLIKNLSTMRETWVRSLDWEDPLEKGKATHSSILAWRIPWTV